MHVIEIRNGELMTSLAARVKDLRITTGAIVSLIGAVDRFTISTMPETDAAKDVITEYGYPAEMSGTGEIVDGVPHIHAVLAVEGDRALSGHLHSATVATHFARVYVIAGP